MDKTFDIEKTQALADRLAEEVNTFKLSIVETSYALASVLEGLGLSIYDLDDTSEAAVEADYLQSPTYAAALIIHSRQIHKIYEMFTQERKAYLDLEQK